MEFGLWSNFQGYWSLLVILVYVFCCLLFIQSGGTGVQIHVESATFCYLVFIAGT